MVKRSQKLVTIKDRVVVTSGVNTRAGFGVQAIFCLSIWVVVTWEFTFIHVYLCFFQ
jgi:hypothetical protein